MHKLFIPQLKLNNWKLRKLKIYTSFKKNIAEKKS